MRAYRLPVRGSGRNSVSLCELRISDPTFTSWGSSKPFPCGFDGHRNRKPALRLRAILPASGPSGMPPPTGDKRKHYRSHLGSTFGGAGAKRLRGL